MQDLCSHEMIEVSVLALEPDPIIIVMCTNCFRKWVYDYVYGLCRLALRCAMNHDNMEVTLILKEIEVMQLYAEQLGSLAVIKAIRTFNSLYPDELNSYIIKFSVN